MGADFVQGMILIPATVLLSCICIWKLGGVSGVFERIREAGLTEQYALIKPAGAFPANAYTLGWAFAIIILQVSQNCSLALSMRYFAVKDGKEASKAAWLTCILMALGTALWFIPPMAARILFNEQVMASALSKPAESAFAVASLNLLPTGLVGVMIIAMFAATASSMDSGLNVNAAMLVRDVIPALRRRFGHATELSSRAELLASRIVTVCFGALMTLLAMQLARGSGKGMFELVLDAATFLSLPLTMPLVLAVFIRRVPPWSALVTVAAGLVVTPVVGWDAPFHVRAMWIFGVCCVVYAGTGFFWKTSSESYRARVDAFFVRMKTPVDFKTEIGEANDGSQLAILGGFTATTGLLLFVLLLIPNPLEGRLLISALAGTVSLSGGAMILRGRMLRPRNK
jgi:Na+/proline symporter